MTTDAVVQPKQPEKFTEFYILGSDGLMSNYPTNLTSGEGGIFTAVIVNHENAPATYLMIYTYNGTITSENTFTLQDGQNMSIPITIITGKILEKKRFNCYSTNNQMNKMFIDHYTFGSTLFDH